MKKLYNKFLRFLNIRRSDKVLLNLLLDITVNACPYGLCYNCIILERFGNISPKEKYRLDDIIRDNRPVYKILNPYYWEPGLRLPRVEWIMQQIAKL